MGPGITLLIFGAILAFGIRAESSFLDTQVIGVILMLGGAAMVWHARTKARRRKVVVRETDGDQGTTHVEERTVVESTDD